MRAAGKNAEISAVRLPAINPRLIVHRAAFGDQNRAFEFAFIVDESDRRRRGQSARERFKNKTVWIFDELAINRLSPILGKKNRLLRAASDEQHCEQGVKERSPAVVHLKFHPMRLIATGVLSKAARQRN